MLRTTKALHQSNYPFPRPFYDTPYDPNRGRLVAPPRSTPTDRDKATKWMWDGIDGTGRGVGLHRAHPLARHDRRSTARWGNIRRTPRDIPRIYSMMMTGQQHASGIQMYYRGGKPPNPSKHPYLDGVPDPVYGWRVTEQHLIRQFHVPHITKDQTRYRPYVALHEEKMFKSVAKAAAEGKQPKDVAPSTSATEPRKKDDESKPFMKRLFFWQ